jgi:hypothetical protein
MMAWPSSTGLFIGMSGGVIPARRTLPVIADITPAEIDLGQDRVEAPAKISWLARINSL